MGTRNQIKLILVGVTLVGMTGCAQKEKPIQITENVIGSSYDYTPPLDAAGRSKPVYLQPKIVLGWNKARVTEDGEWVGGHYTATVVEPGRWADLEEAERAKRPYIVPGEVPLIPEIGRPPGPTGGGPSEIEISNLASRVASMERNTPKLNRQVSDQELMDAAASRGVGFGPVQGAITPTGPASGSARRPTTGGTAARPGATPAAAASPQVPPSARPSAPPSAPPMPPVSPPTSEAPPARSMEQSRGGSDIPVGAESPPDGSFPEAGQMQPIELIGVAPRPVWIPYHPAGVQIEFAVPGRRETLAADYLEGRGVRFRWLDKTYRATFTDEPQRFILGP